MKKSIAAVCGFAAFLLVAGAGCNEASKPNENNTVDNESTSPVSVTTEPTNTLTLKSVVSAAPGTVQATWTLPTDFDKTHSVRLLHSAKATPEFPGAYWTQYTSATTEANIKNVPSGQRYFRLCEFQSVGNTCVKYSEISGIEVK